MDAPENLIRNLGRDEGPGKPRKGERSVLLELLHVMRTKLHPFGNSALCEVLARERQSRLPRVNPDDSQRQRVLRAAASCPVQAIMVDMHDKGVHDKGKGTAS